jgi:hypothetical protein
MSGNLSTSPRHVKVAIRVLDEVKAGIAAEWMTQKVGDHDTATKAEREQVNFEACSIADARGILAERLVELDPKLKTQKPSRG